MLTIIRILARGLSSGLERDANDILSAENAILRRELVELRRQLDEYHSSEFAQGSVGPPVAIPLAHMTRVANLKAVIIDLITMFRSADNGWSSPTDQMRIRTAEAVHDSEEPKLG